MKNTTRNSLVLGGLLVLVLLFGLLLGRRYGTAAHRLQAENEKIEAEIKTLDFQLAKIDSLQGLFDIQSMVASQTKLVFEKDNPTITYRYLLRLLSWMRRQMIFDFASSKNDPDKSNWNEYIISGRGSYRDLINFTANIEHQRAILTIEELSLSADTNTSAAGDTVSYSMVLRTHFKQGGSSPDEVSKADIPAQYLGYNPFQRRIYDTAPEREYAPGLLRLSGATLIGIADYRIFVRDEDNVIKILSLGDKIAGGYLYAINPGQGKAVFRIDTYGVWEEQSLYLNQPN